MNQWIDKCHFGDCRDTMRAMIADGVKVQTIVTSPPYWGLRSYLPEGHENKNLEIGMEPTLREFIDTLTGVFELCRELLADDGTAWVNMGDTYAGSWGNQGRKETRGTQRAINGEMMQPVHDGRYPTKQSNTGKITDPGLKPKDLMGQPWRLAFALQDAGWYLRQDIVWKKPNPMPESVKDRCTKAHEYVFLLSKSERYFYDIDAVREPHETSDRKGERRSYSPGSASSHRIDGGHEKQSGSFAGLPLNEAGRNKRSVWTIATQSFDGAHFATFPEALVEPCVLAGSRTGDIVFDPFLGSGTVAQVAQRLGRKWVGCELNESYGLLQKERLRQPSLCLEVA